MSSISPDLAGRPGRWPRRVPHRIEVPATSLVANLQASAAAYPDKAALVFLDRVTTYSALAHQVDRLAAALGTLGVARGDRVLLDMQNCPQLVVAHFAILRANAVVVPVNPMNRCEELKHYIVDASPRVAITTGDLAGELAQASNQLEPSQRLAHLVVTQFSDAFDVERPPDHVPLPWRSWLWPRHGLPALTGGEVHVWTTLLETRAAAAELMVTASDLAVVPYTSGTTGAPKGCMHTHASLMHNALASQLWVTGSSSTVMLCAIPLFHITGMVTVMHSTIAGGGTLVVLPRWDRDFAGRQISAWGVTHWTNIPTMIIDLLASPDLARYDLSSLVYVGGGGAAMPEAVAARLLETYGLRYVEGYGLTETAAPTHYNPPDDPKPQCLGIPFIGVEAKLIDPETCGVLASGEIGEIVVRGPSLFEGYWNRQEATAQAFIEIGGRRFFRTGDIGRIDEDGYFFLTDRLKRMINASGFKVWPAEVEGLIFGHPSVQEVCVVATPDAYRGESVMAVIVRRPGHATTEAEILAWCRDHMAVYKAPRAVRFMDALPRSGSGKVLWRELQASAANLKQDGVAASRELP
jgi:fatty-acyl-CoA synthase